MNRNENNFERTFQPTMVTRTEWEWLNLQDIADACQKLCDSVTARISGAKVAWLFTRLYFLERRP